VKLAEIYAPMIEVLDEKYINIEFCATSYQKDVFSAYKPFYYKELAFFEIHYESMW
jgi:hypothetical protein